MLAKPLMFLSSYAPLFVLLAIRFDGEVLRWICTLLALGGVVALLLLLRLDRGSEAGSHTIAEVRSAGAEASSYLAGYLLPFLTVSRPSVADLIAYAGFLAVAAMVHLRTGVIQVNPLLYCLGWSVVSITDDRRMSAYLLTKRRVLPGDEVWATRLSDDVLVNRPP